MSEESATRDLVELARQPRAEEIVDMGHGVVFSSAHERGRLMGSDAFVEQRRGFVVLSIDGEIARGTLYLDIAAARAAAERLAAERG